MIKNKGTYVENAALNGKNYMCEVRKRKFFLDRSIFLIYNATGDCAKVRGLE